MQRKDQKAYAQPRVIQLSEYRDARTAPLSADDTCDHTWRFLMPGFEMCTSCGRIRIKPTESLVEPSPIYPARSAP